MCDEFPLIEQDLVRFICPVKYDVVSDLLSHEVATVPNLVVVVVEFIQLCGRKTK